MKLHLDTIGDSRCNYLNEEYKTPTGTLSIGDLIEKINNNIVMIDIAFSLSYEKFDEVKDFKTSFEMWHKIKDIYDGDENVRRAKVESLRGQFDQIKIRENENIAKYVE